MINSLGSPYFSFMYLKLDINEFGVQIVIKLVSLASIENKGHKSL